MTQDDINMITNRIRQTAVCPIKSEFPQCSQISIREYLFFKNCSNKMRISIPRILICEHCGNSDFMGQTTGRVFTKRDRKALCRRITTNFLVYLSIYHTTHTLARYSRSIAMLHYVYGNGKRIAAPRDSFQHAAKTKAGKGTDSDRFVCYLLSSELGQNRNWLRVL